MGDGLLRVTLAVPVVDSLAWLRRAPAGQTRVRWTARGDGGEAFAGIGEAMRLEAGSVSDGASVAVRLRDVLRRSRGGVRFVGGLSFDRHHAGGPDWRGFGSGWFVVPRLELRLQDGLCLLSVQTRADALEGFEEGLAWASAMEAAPEEPPEPGGAERPGADGVPPWGRRRDMPDREGWHVIVTRALDAFRAGVMQKVVLARHTRIQTDRAVDALALAGRLREVTGGGYHFLFQPAGADTFVGASPERLYARDGRRLLSEAVAGTRPRGATPAEDGALAAELMASDKDRREHAYVCDGLRAALGPYCERLHIEDAPSLIKLSMGQHLRTAVEGLLREGVEEDTLLPALHPTPALGGWPREPALRAIADWEGFDRGWYGAPVGWIARNEAEFAVAIRSALVDDTGISLFSGAGIVAGSTPEEEWREIEQKIADFMRVLGGGQS